MTSKMSKISFVESWLSHATSSVISSGIATSSVWRSAIVASSMMPVILQLPFCARSSTWRPFSDSSGLPPLPVACVKKTGLQTTPVRSLSRAFSRCFSSRTCLIDVAFENCLAWMAFVTSPHSCSDSFLSCSLSGGSILGATERGAMSTMVV